MSNILDTLIKARDHISNPAMWYKGGYSDDGRTGAEDGFPCCAMGALVWVNPDVGIFCNDAYRPLRDALPAEWTSIPYFNDAPATTHADILALFDRAIAAERAKIGGAL